MDTDDSLQRVAWNHERCYGAAFHDMRHSAIGVVFHKGDLTGMIQHRHPQINVALPRFH